MNLNYLSVLEYPKILELAADCCMSSVAREKILAIRPFCTKEDIVRELARTREAFIILFEFADRPVTGFDSVSEYLGKIEKGAILEIRQLLRIGRLLRLAEELQDAILKYDDERIVELCHLANMITHAPELVATLERSIYNEEELSDEASPKLASAREEIRVSQNKIKEKLRHYIAGTQYSTVLQDRLITIRDGRYVLPVKSEYKSSINGIVHDTSDSGATTYIEPMAIIELNNHLREAEAAEEAEVQRILAELSRLVAHNSEIIINNEYYYTLFDVIFARASLADKSKCSCPLISENGVLEITDARHPLLDPMKVVPTTVSLGEGKRLLIISGPNTGGKTVVLKTIGLFCAMAYSGFFLPCKEAILPLFNGVYCDIGDNQSIAESLSTFSSHIKTIKEILAVSTKNTLVLLDELGAGTDPIEGAALAVSIVKALVQKGLCAVITTHYSELKEYGLITPSVENASMEFNPITLEPTYRLKMGLPGVSNAIGIAAMLGLDKGILESAQAYIGEGKRTFESVLAMADVARTEALNEKEILTEERRKLEKDIDLLNLERARVDETFERLTQKAHQEVEKLMEKYIEQAEDIVEKMNELQKDVNESNLLRAKQLRTSLSGIELPIERENDFIDIDPTTIKIGDDVIVKRLNSFAKIKTMPDRQGKLEVSVGNLALSMTVKDLAKRNFTRKEAEPKKVPTVRHSAASISTSGSTVTEINLLGKTVDEAIPLVDALIDSALLHGIEQLRIIHGVGTGALRKGLTTHFCRHRAIKSTRGGAYGEGGYGVTIVTLK